MAFLQYEVVKTYPIDNCRNSRLRQYWHRPRLTFDKLLVSAVARKHFLVLCIKHK